MSRSRMNRQRRLFAALKSLGYEIQVSLYFGKDEEQDMLKTMALPTWRKIRHRLRERAHVRGVPFGMQRLFQFQPNKELHDRICSFMSKHSLHHCDWDALTRIEFWNREQGWSKVNHVKAILAEMESIEMKAAKTS